MDNLKLTQVFAGLVGLLAVAGLFTEGHLFGIMNVDMLLDVIRVLLLVGLVYAGFVSKAPSVVSGVLLVTGATYLVMGVVGLFDRTLMGMLPAGLTAFDLLFHQVLGVVALWAGVRGRQ